MAMNSFSGPSAGGSSLNVRSTLPDTVSQSQIPPVSAVSARASVGVEAGRAHRIQELAAERAHAVAMAEIPQLRAVASGERGEAAVGRDGQAPPRGCSQGPHQAPGAEISDPDIAAGVGDHGLLPASGEFHGHRVVAHATAGFQNTRHVPSAYSTAVSCRLGPLDSSRFPSGLRQTDSTRSPWPSRTRCRHLCRVPTPGWSRRCCRTPGIVNTTTLSHFRWLLSVIM